MPTSLVVWDLHGVLVSGAPADQDAFAATVDLPPSTWQEVREQYCDRERAWDQVERGEVALMDFAAELSRRIGAAGGRATPAIAATIWGDPSPFRSSRARPELLDAVRGAPAHARQAVGTNNVRDWRRYWHHLLDLADFDWVFDSSAIGHRKPETGYWEHVERRTGIPGRSIVLVDDRGSNIEAARRHGWSTIHFTDSARCLTELRAWLGTAARAMRDASRNAG
jgi:FMN phosphatase YigB (HAD superfamily)